jgi:Flp pilus assembly protein TadD
LGIAYGNFKQYEQAISAFREAVRIEPEKASVWYNLGEAYSRYGQQDKVLEIYQTLHKLDPLMANAYSNIFMLPLARKVGSP